MYLKAVGVQIAVLVCQRHDAFLPTRGKYNGGEADRVGVIPVCFLKTAGEADLLDDGAEGWQADGQE